MDDLHIAYGAGGGRQLRRARGERSWRSPRNQACFLLHLTATANVKRSAQAAGLCLAGAYRIRARDAGFRERWNAALRDGHARLHALVIEGAAAQAQVPLGDDGEIDRIALAAYDPRVALALLKMHGPTVAGEALGRGQPVPRSADELRAVILLRIEALASLSEASGEATTAVDANRVPDGGRSDDA